MTDTHAAAEGEGNEAAPGNDNEGRARRMGWIPKEEFRGPEEKWVDADAFIEKTETEVPILRERNRFLDDQLVRQQKETSELKTKIDEMGQVLTEFRDHSRGAEERAYKRAKAELEQEMRDAVAEADTEKFEAAKQKFDDLEEPAPAKEPEKKTEPEPPEQPKVSPTAEAWVRDNKWFDEDPVLNNFAIAQHGENMKAGMTEEASLKAITKDVKTRFPEKFHNPRRDTASTVSEPSPPGDKPKGRTVNDLPPEAKEILERFKRTIPGYTDEEYLKNYEWDD